MTGWVILCWRRGGWSYVAHPGSAHSYTARLEEARIYPTAAAAEADRCPENETLHPLSGILSGPTGADRTCTAGTRVQSTGTDGTGTQKLS